MSFDPIRAVVQDAALDDIRNDVGQMDDHIPFLLLPVRLETRFMEVDHPVTEPAVPAVTAGTVLTDLGILVQKLETISRQPMEAAEKPKKKELYGQLDRLLRDISGQCARLEGYYRDTIAASPEEIARIQEHWRKIESAAGSVPGHLARMRSNYLREQYLSTFSRVQSSALERVAKLFASVTIPKMSFLAAFKQGPAAAYRKAAEPVFRNLQTLAPRGSSASLRRLETSLQKLKKHEGLLLTGTSAEIEELDRSRQAAATPAGRNEPGPPSAKKLRPELQKSAARYRPRLVRNSDLTFSLQTYNILIQDLNALEAGIKEAVSLRGKDRLKNVDILLQGMIDRMAGRLHRPVLLPAAYKKRLLATVNRLKRSDLLRTAVGAEPKQLAAFREKVDRYTGWISSLQTEADSRFGPAVVVPTRTMDELWVRIYPDDVFVHAHEPELTAEEIEAGKTYWREQWLTGGNQETAQAAWRLLTSKYSVQRAAWIVRQLKPTMHHPPHKGRSDPETLQAVLKKMEELLRLLRRPAGKDRDVLVREVEVLLGQIRTELAELKQGGRSLLARVRETWSAVLHALKELGAPGSKARPKKAESQIATLQEQADQVMRSFEKIVIVDAKRPGPAMLPLVFPEVPTKNQAWVQQPRAFVMPDKFVVLTQVGETFTHIRVGKQIPDPLPLGLNPQMFSAISRDAEGNLSQDQSIKWLTDFQEAVNQGMGIVIPLTPEEKQQGFDKVLVLGVKKTTEGDAAAKLEALLENHHYKTDGMEFIPLGTATNNTDQKQAGFMSRDDKDAAWKIECGEALFRDGETDPVKVSDGQRLARALGISAAVFQHIGNSGLNEISQAMTVNRVLAPATLGYFLDEIIAPLIPRDAAGRLRDFFTRYVIGRGLLPSLRIGTQPYGVLVTSAFSRFRMFPDEDNVLAAGQETDPQQRFEILLRRFLWMLHEDWARVLLPEVKCAANTDAANPQAHFMTMLGLEAHSLTTYFRYAVNCASRLAYAATETVNVNFEPGAFYSPYAFLERVAGVLGLNLNEKEDLQRTVLSLPLYRMRFLENQGDLKGERVAKSISENQALPVGTDNFLQWLITKDPYAIWNRNQIADLPSTSLLFLLLRHAWLLNYREAALDILQFEKLITEEIRSKAGSPDYYHTYSPVKKHQTFITKWNYLFTGLSQLDGLFDHVFDAQSPFYLRMQPNVSMAEYLQNLTAAQEFSGHQESLDKLKAARADFAALQNIATAKLDRLLAEHLDTCSYRFDAWQLGLAHQRLLRQRVQRPRGVFLGAFGWVENLRPDHGRPLAKTVPAELSKPAEGPVYYDEENEGFIHAPSINHAMTAAMLRSGYAANRKTGDLRNPLAVNLTSERVRMALRLLEGVRQGVEVGALLGYQFERGLHERYADHVELDKYIYPFRRNFPGTPAVDQDLEKDQEQRQVVDGAKMLKTVRDKLGRDGTIDPGATLYEALIANLGLYPFDLYDAQADPLADPKPGLLPPLKPSVPPVPTPELDAVLKEINRMADAFDALSDLMMAESVYQVAQGNHVRASAVVAALAEGKNPPQPEIIETPRTGKLITQRVLLNIPPLPGNALSPQSGLTEAERRQNLDLARAPHWEDIPFSPRALAEPSLNRWLGTMVGDPEQIRCWVEYRTTSTFSAGDIVNIPAFIARLKAAAGGLDSYLSQNLSEAAKTLLSEYPRCDQAVLLGQLAQDLTTLVQGPSIYDEQLFSGVTLRAATRQLISRNVQGDLLLRLNRLLLEDAYPDELSRKPGGTPASIAVSLRDLGLQPLDAVLLLGSASGGEQADELNARIAYFVRRTLTLGIDTELTVKAAERSVKLLKTDLETLTPDIMTFYETAPLLRSLAQLLSDARPGSADDLILPENNDHHNRTGQDLDELKLRLSDLNNTVKDRIITWLDFFEPLQDHTAANPDDISADDYVYSADKIAADYAYLKTRLADLRAFLFSGAELGIPHAVPQSVLEDGEDQVKALVMQGNDVFRTVLRRWRAARPLLAQGTVSGCMDAARELGGPNFRILPLFKVNNADELKQAASQGPDQLRRVEAQGLSFPLDTWLQGLGKSRKKMSTVETLKLLGSFLNRPFPDPSLTQLPAGADYWVGLQFPEDFQPARHTLSLVHLNLPRNWTESLCALVLDEWTETLPNFRELTGITFNYNQPDSTAPQSLLLAVPLVERGRWVWDDLVYTLLDTLELAKLRAVEPEHVDKTLFSQLLPTVLGEVVPADMQNLSINPLGVQVVVDFAANNNQAE